MARKDVDGLMHGDGLVLEVCRHGIASGFRCPECLSIKLKEIGAIRKEEEIEFVESAKEEHEASVAECREATNRSYAAKRRLYSAMAKLYRVDSWSLYPGIWTCPDSPVSRCLYDKAKDPGLDRCLVCGQSEERR